MSSPGTLYTIEQELLVKAKKSLKVSVSALLCSCFFFPFFFICDLDGIKTVCLSSLVLQRGLKWLIFFTAVHVRED